MYVGIDPSLSSTGIVALFDDGSGQESRIVGTKRLDRLCGTVGDSSRVYALSEKLLYVLEELAWGVNEHTIAVEGPAFGRVGTGSIQTGMLHHAVYRTLANHFDDADRVVVLTVPPMMLKRWATGNGKADKKEMIKGISVRWGVRFSKHDLYDAYALAKVAQAYKEDTLEKEDRNKLEAHKLAYGEYTEVLNAPSSANRRRKRRRTPRS